MSDHTIKPCPFCGQKPAVYRGAGVVIKCKTPDCVKPKTEYWCRDYEHKALEQWNRRDG